MNKVMLCGRLTADPEARRGQNDMAIARFTVAVDRLKKDAGADFIKCVAFSKTAEFAEKYLTKGTKMLIEGHIQTGSYDDKDGKKVYTTDVIVDQVEFAESKQSVPNKPANPVMDNPAQGFTNIPIGVDDEGLPFA